MEKQYKINLSNTIHQIKKIYFTVGLWKTKNGIAIVSQFFFFMLISSFTLSVFVQANITDKKDESVFLTVTSLIGILQVYRMYYVIMKQKGILDVLDTVSVNSTNDYETYCSADNKLKKLMIFAKNWVYVSLFLFVAVTIVPLLKKGLIFDIAFPFDYKRNAVAFWVAYVYVAGTFLLSVTLILFVVIIIWYMMLNFVVKYEILGNNFKNLGKIVGSETQTLASPQIKHDFYSRHLIEAIESIENINELLDEFGSMFSNLFLLQVFTSSSCICGAVGTLAFSSHDNILEDGFYFVVLCFCCFDTFTLMYLGNEIQLSFDRLSYCLFESDWIEQTQSSKLCVLIIMERLKKSKLLIVGKLFPMNLRTFGVIVNRAYSMFNVLQNMAT